MLYMMILHMQAILHKSYLLCNFRQYILCTPRPILGITYCRGIIYKKSSQIFEKMFSRMLCINNIVI